jgi:outer membrane protein OmpA-like peptidoglycan-associated protein
MNYRMKPRGTKALAVVMAVALLSGNSACAQQKKLNKSQKGAIVGASGGAVVGAMIGKAKGSTAMGAILGATVGGAAGAVIGHRMDKRAEEIKRQMPDAQVERVGEGIKVSLGSDILFDTDSYALKPATRQQLNQFAQTLNKEEDTDILVEGHADATGSEEHNLKLYKQRADAVANYLENQGVKTSRVDEKGYGEAQPIADNATASGRQKNRRVDIAIFANKKMQRDAKDGKLGD